MTNRETRPGSIELERAEGLPGEADRPGGALTSACSSPRPSWIRAAGRAAAGVPLLLIAVGGCAPAGSGAAPAAAQVAVAAEIDTLAEGVTHRYIRDPDGPWAIHVVEVLPDACGVRVGSVAAHDRVIGVERTSDMARRSAGGDRRILAAVNADFFRAEPLGVPEGPQVSGGEVVAAAGSYGPSVAERFEVSQPVFGITRTTEAFIGAAELEGRAWTAGGASFPLARVNAPPGPDSLALFNRFADGPPPEEGRSRHVTVRVLRAPLAAGDTVRGVVERASSPEDGAGAAGRAIFNGRGRAGSWVASLAPGDTVVWTLPFEGAPGPVLELVGGFPLLLRDGEPVLDEVPGIYRPFAHGRHPRTAVGLGADGGLYLVVVDGRQPPYSDGMTLGELTAFLLELGAVDAVNLDGGGSTTLVIGDRVTNRPSDGLERPVANALLLWRSGPADGAHPADAYEDACPLAGSGSRRR